METKKISWQSPSNIALIKYWGKYGEQLPMNPSISLCLSKSTTTTTIHVTGKNSDNSIKSSFLFEGEQNDKFNKRIQLFINNVSKYFPSLLGFSLEINSHNSFPHSTGIASSASAMSALALCLVQLEKESANNHFYINNFYKKASFIARLGSGSAARSIYGAYNLWGKTIHAEGSSDEYAMDINQNLHEVFKSYHDAILIVSDAEKKVSSSIGHKLMDNHPFSEQKFKESHKNTKLMLNILKNGDQLAFTELTEKEALSLHAMMLTSTPSFVLMEPNTLAIIEEIKNFRKLTNIPICFTLDAGANVHLLYPHKNRNSVLELIHNKLVKHCIKNTWIDDCVGSGPIHI